MHHLGQEGGFTGVLRQSGGHTYGRAEGRKDVRDAMSARTQ